MAAFEARRGATTRALLSFSRHIFSAHDAEDVVQHAFLAADREFRSGRPPKAIRAWLYTVARNGCVSILRARRDEPGAADAGMPSTENLAAEVEQREDLRGLLADLRELPDDQRTALLLAEMGELSHPEVAKVIGVRPGKVKALVFQARETLRSVRARAGDPVPVDPRGARGREGRRAAAAAPAQPPLTVPGVQRVRGRRAGTASLAEDRAAGGADGCACVKA